MMFGVGVLGAIVFSHAALYTWRNRVSESQARAWPFFKFFADAGLIGADPICSWPSRRCWSPGVLRACSWGCRFDISSRRRSACG